MSLKRENIRFDAFGFSISSQHEILLKFKFVVDNDTILHGVHTDTVAFSPCVLIKWTIRSYHQSLTRTTHEWIKKTAHGVWHTATLNHHCSVTLVNVAFLVTQRSGGAEFGDRCSSLLLWWAVEA